MADADLLVALGFAAVCRAVMLAVACVLLWLRPRTVAKRLLGLALAIPAVLGIFDVGFLLDFPGGAPAWFLVPDLGADVAALFIFTFLASYPTPIRWRSREGAVYAAIILYASVAPFIQLTLVLTGASQTPWKYFTGYNSPAYGVLHVIAIALALRRLRAVSEPAERKSAQRIVASIGVLGFVFAGYGILAKALKILGIPHHQRYGDTDAIFSLAASALIGFLTSIGFATYVYVRYREKIVLLVAALGALAVVLDQFSPYDIIDFGVFNLVIPLVAFHGATRSGAFGVTKVPARVGIMLSVVTGISTCILVAAVFTLVAGQQPFFLMVGSFAGLILGAIIAYQLRPRGVGIAIYRHPEEAAPSRALTGTRVAPGALIAGRYRVDRVLGEGGEGHAFLAQDAVLARDVVLKTVIGGGQAAVREARLVAMLEHPNIVRVYDVLETAQETVLVLEFADGGSLRGLLDRRAPLPRAEADGLLSEILAGLQAAHEVGVVHGDVKPENVLLGGDGNAKIADFGSARARDAARPNATVQQSAASGTVAYMSPEQARGNAATERSDLYAAALCYHEMLTGATGRESALGGSLDALQQRTLIASGETTIRVKDPELARFFHKALAREASARFASAEEMGAALAALSPARGNSLS